MEERSMRRRTNVVKAERSSNFTRPGKIKKRRPKKSAFARIDWEKAVALFHEPPKQEKESGTYPSTKEILSFLAGVGVIGLILAFPPAIGGVAAFIRLGRRDYSGWGMRRTLRRLKKQKYISVSEDDKGNVTVQITEQGMTRALSYKLETMVLAKPKSWDKKWRVVAFDIPEKYKRLRDVFRMRLGQLGLYQLQESVYVSPYQCFKEIEFLRELYGVAFTVRYIVAARIEDDESLKQRFQLR
ncbi:hypothetical protein A2971_00925 [Candidatus Gottesmanbacteria bacterium RIFCSPLOWO2_01_FULL_46_21]|uniref:Transcriptional repressor PaaX-like central Cas2-like domain-containing protein n=1 Tax=Candidatus Gottesmanbacteria bacterium RIFCSPLOWO2_01_FULL_46_21 TaxID=1798393 RepID=A0A1F6AY88_9BACT|nr:MAG: hypothetical protein A2971_00925 [Candidatus Gottesmanbacteria bacterium RIFCSPLOWO2_01_FULL_46_21]